eukprot:CAMPEP_0117740144 /NCGR_PEP_ID=MMETSP0947-20121206/4171_1 /TAXON_ID=44440 /ORGANISM="Chattonella subsalsa, Strain CCMP2191" /LENGTH=665 /DNA_ID=CAMNT_0005556211 /DNA_START=373 /DNA_END=2370 /DNA_ORIENTATION=-
MEKLIRGLKDQAEFCDIYFEVDGNHFDLHSVILGTRMKEYLIENGLLGGQRHSTRGSSPEDRLILKNLPGGSIVFEEIIQFCYMDTEFSIRLKNLARLYYAAGYFGLKGPENLCEAVNDYMKQQVVDDDSYLKAIEVYKMAYDIELAYELEEELSTQCLMKIVSFIGDDCDDQLVKAICNAGLIHPDFADCMLEAAKNSFLPKKDVTDFVARLVLRTTAEVSPAREDSETFMATASPLPAPLPRSTTPEEEQLMEMILEENTDDDNGNKSNNNAVEHNQDRAKTDAIRVPKNTDNASAEEKSNSLLEVQGVIKTQEEELDSDTFLALQILVKELDLDIILDRHAIGLMTRHHKIYPESHIGQMDFIRSFLEGRWRDEFVGISTPASRACAQVCLNLFHDYFKAPPQDEETLQNLMSILRFTVEMLVKKLEGPKRYMSRCEAVNWRKHLQVGDFLDVLDSEGKWQESVVVGMDPHIKKVKMHIKGWSEKTDFYIEPDSRDLQPLYTHTKNWRIKVKPGDKIQVADDSGPVRKWHPAKVLSVDRVADLALVQTYQADQLWVDIEGEEIRPIEIRSSKPELNGIPARGAKLQRRKSLRDYVKDDLKWFRLNTNQDNLWREATAQQKSVQRRKSWSSSSKAKMRVTPELKRSSSSPVPQKMCSIKEEHT